MSDAIGSPSLLQTASRVIESFDQSTYAAPLVIGLILVVIAIGNYIRLYSATTDQMREALARSLEEEAATFTSAVDEQSDAN